MASKLHQYIQAGMFRICPHGVLVGAIFRGVEMEQLVLESSVRDTEVPGSC
jgi:hypothetical protein